MQELIKIQSELKAPKNQRNNFGKYNYRSCEDILEALKPLLKQNDCILVIDDEVKQVGDLIFIEATATISKEGFTVSSKAQAGINPNRKGMDISQSFGSSSSYARKYALNGLFLIDDTKDSDTGVHSDQPELINLTAQAAQENAQRGVSIEQMRTLYAMTPDQETKYLKLLNQ